MSAIKNVFLEASENFAELNHVTLEQAMDFMYKSEWPLPAYLMYNDYCRDLKENTEP